MIKEAISTLVAGQSLTADEAALAMGEIMSGEATPAQIGAFITALRMKGETVEEIAGLARAMRARAMVVSTSLPVVDTCGTGGDGHRTFNISTAAAFVVAGAGVAVAKHGNRAMTSQCGSADVLEALGANISLNAAQVSQSLEEVGIAFIFAPLFHPAMKHAAGPRREIGIRSVFNILGPLTNPAGAKAQVIGVADGPMALKMAQALRVLGSRHALVVHAEDGLDELSISAPTQVYEVRGQSLESYTVVPERFGLARAGLADIAGGTAQENAARLRQVLSGEAGPRRDVVLLNAAAGLVASDRVRDLAEGVPLAAQAIDSGAALSKLNQFIQFSQQVK